MLSFLILHYLKHVSIEFQEILKKTVLHVLSTSSVLLIFHQLIISLNYSEQLILSVADSFYKDGYQEAGFEYIIIDDCWSEKQRDKNGRLVADRKRFPRGMKYIADYVCILLSHLSHCWVTDMVWYGTLAMAKRVVDHNTSNGKTSWNLWVPNEEKLVKTENTESYWKRSLPTDSISWEISYKDQFSHPLQRA